MFINLLSLIFLQFALFLVFGMRTFPNFHG